MKWVCLEIEYDYDHYGDLHVAVIDNAGTGQPPQLVFLNTLLVERIAKPLLNIVARANALRLRKIFRRKVTQNLYSASVVCTKLNRVLCCAELQSQLRRRLLLDLVQSRLGKGCIVPHPACCSCATCAADATVWIFSDATEPYQMLQSPIAT